MRSMTLILIALLIAGCSRSDSSGDSGDAANPVAEVQTALATSGGAAETVNAYGVAEQGAGNEHGLTTQAEATLTNIAAPTGTSVSAGQLVAALRPSASSRLDLGKATSDARSARDALARATRLKRDGLASDADVNAARAAFESASQTLAAARAKNATLSLRAPVAGTVQGLTAKVGDLIAAGTTVATIGTRGELRIHFGVDPSIAARVHTGQSVTISAINANTSIMTRVIGVDPQVDPATHLASIYASFPAGQSIGPGQPIRGSITVAGSLPGVMIPYSALLDDGGHTYVFVVEKNVARKHAVTPGNSSGDTVQILSGLQPNERVVVEGGTALEDGMKVTERGTTAPRERSTP